jgi:hypothetical protein
MVAIATSARRSQDLHKQTGDSARRRVRPGSGDLRDYDGPCFDGAAIVHLRRETDGAQPGMRPALPSMTSGAPT